MQILILPVPVMHPVCRLAPPASIDILGYTHNAKVEVRENQELTLSCVVAGAKPAAQIQWYRKNVEFKPGM